MPPTELVKQEGAQMLSTIVAAARENANPQIIRELWEIAKEVRDFDAKHAFQNAMKACQDEMKPVVKRSENPQTHSKYAKLEAIDKAIKPVYLKHGFSITWGSGMVENGKVLVTATVMHSGGYSKDYSLPGPLDILGLKGSPNKTEMHGLGSSLSYLKRYLKCFIFDIALVDEDDDGNGADPVISDEHLAKLEKLIDQCQMSAEERKRFTDAMGVEMTGEIKERDLERAIARLRDFFRAKKGAAK